ncbi:MAG: T9SS type A sorting domain-containing protein [Ferruginibacter sp.]|nr:T9SS type A sorting domain-containing protein [Chitinophagaceae bacterium]MBP6285833.1 T9SS type A sorting domain-containing protein [Ferruginibacter sp.]MBU9936527.1 T9SS type A sorting domain-containing protein [Ferruginibacter sp.]
MNLKLLLSTSFIAASLVSAAQDANRTFAITGDGNGDFMWMNIRQVDISTGKIVQDIYQRNKTAYTLADADTKRPVDNMARPTETMVAAAAYDKNQNKLFFTPMRVGELRWLDLGAQGDARKFYTVKSVLLNSSESIRDEAKNFTRMVIAADGNGYALTNDGNRLIRFTTGKKVTITDLGNLVDDESNKTISIHNQCSSWGGDMIADAYNKLYVISANHYVFSVNVETRVAKYMGYINGLPANYSTNGAAVDKEGAIVVSSANTFAGYYKFTLTDLNARKIEGSDMVYNASDLANGNLLYQKEADAAKNYGTADFKAIVPVITNEAHIFPNPVTANEFRISFEGLAAGRYHVTVTDLSGKPVMNRVVTVNGKTQVETVPLNRSFAKGMYMVKVTDANNKFIFTERIVVQ